MSDHRESTRPAGRLVELVDRFFPLSWIAVYALLPVSGFGASALVSNFDQKRDLEALRSVLANGRAKAIADNLIGPAYIATAALIHDISGLTPEDSLIALSRVSYVLAVAGCMVLVRVLVRRLGAAPASVSVTAQFAVMALVFSAGTWHWSDIPWSHFYAAFLGIAFYALRFVPIRITVVGSAMTGVVLALLALTRSFEFVAVVAAWMLGLVILRVLRIRGVRSLRPASLGLGAGMFVATIVVVDLITGKHGSFLLYRSSRGENYGDLIPGEVGHIPTFDLGLVPLKLVQIFIDPCYYSLCQVNDYARHSSWALPLAIQLPALVALPFCVVAVAVLLTWSARHRVRAQPRARELRLLVEMTIAATGLTLGYVASTWSSSSALQYGFARDFLLPALLAGVVAVGLAFVGLYVALVRSGGLRVPTGRGRLSPGGASVLLGLVGAIAVVASVVVARTHGLPRLESRHLDAIEYTADCRRGTCDVGIEAVTVNGGTISIPQSSLLTFGCGGDAPQFTIHVPDPTKGFSIPKTCGDPRLVAAWPTVMGVPPNSGVLRVVRVANTNAA